MYLLWKQSRYTDNATAAKEKATFGNLYTADYISLSLSFPNWPIFTVFILAFADSLKTLVLSLHPDNTKSTFTICAPHREKDRMEWKDSEIHFPFSRFLSFFPKVKKRFPAQCQPKMLPRVDKEQQNVVVSIFVTKVYFLGRRRDESSLLH